MTQQQQRPTAKIYAFPKRPRAASGNRPYANELPLHEAQVPAVDCGAGWYHEAALHDADDDRKVSYRKN